MSKTNWKKTFNKDYLGAHDLDDGNGGYKTLDVVIKRVTMRDVKDPNGQKECVRVAEFEGNAKPMILNVGACQTIEGFTHSRYIEDWAGCPVRLYVELDVHAFGAKVDALRIAPEQPRIREELTPAHDKWAGAVEKFKTEGEAGLSVVLKYFDLSPANRKALEDAAAAS